MKTDKIIKVTGMSCAACSAAVNKALLKTQGVLSCNVNFASGDAKVEYDNSIISSESIKQIIINTGYGVKSETETDELSQKENFYQDDLKKMLIAWIFSGPLMLIMLYGMIFGMGHHFHKIYHWFAIIFSLIVFIFPGRKTLVNAYKSIRLAAPSMDVLIALGSISAFITGFLPGMSENHSFIEISSMIIAIHLTGRYIEAKTKGKTSEAIRKLMELGAKSASIIKNGSIIEVPVSDLCIDDEMLIKPGAKIPTDGIVTEGESYIDESMATGESMPVRKKTGHNVLGATINGNSTLKVKVTKIGKDTFLSQMIKLVENAQNTKVPIQAFADKVTGIFVPIVIVIAITSFFTHILFPEINQSIIQLLPFSLPWMMMSMSTWVLALFAAISVLVIACPCALGLATPTAIMAGIGLGTKHGIIIRNGEAVQVIKKAKTIIFDKTGTLTQGKPIVTNLDVLDMENKLSILQAMFSIEQLSDHPLAQAIVNKLKTYDFPPQIVSDFISVNGKGITATIDNEKWFIGNLKFLQENNIIIKNEINQILNLQKEAKTIVLGAKNSELKVIIGISDQIKPDAFLSIEILRKMNIKTVMLTGDNAVTANEVAKKLGIIEVKSEVLPEDKLNYVKEYQKNNNVVIMVGDGINDAPALKQADVSIAIGGGTDIAIESADIVLVRNEVLPVVKAIILAKTIFRIIQQNLFWAFFYNLVSIPLAFFGLLHPIVAEAAMGMSSVTVVSNANRLRNMKLNLPSAKINKEIIKVSGMTCNHCVNRIKSNLEKLPGLKNVNISLEENTVEMIFNSEFPLEKAKEIINGLGFMVEE